MYVCTHLSISILIMTLCAVTPPVYILPPPLPLPLPHGKILYEVLKAIFHMGGSSKVHVCTHLSTEKMIASVSGIEMYGNFKYT